MQASLRRHVALVAALLAGTTGLAAAQTNPGAPPRPADSTASTPGAMGDKATRPPAATEAAKSGVATKKPAKAGAQSGPASAPSTGPAGAASNIGR